MENPTLVRGLLVGLWERGLDVTRTMLVGIDGSRRCARLWMCSTTRSSNAAKLHNTRKVKTPCCNDFAAVSAAG